MSKKANLKRLQLPKSSINLNGNSKSTEISNYFGPAVDDTNTNGSANKETSPSLQRCAEKCITKDTTKLLENNTNENVTKVPRRSTRRKLKDFISNEPHKIPTISEVNNLQNDDEFDVTSDIIKKAPKKRLNAKQTKLKSSFLKNEEKFSKIIAQQSLMDDVSSEDLQIALAISKSEAEISGDCKNEFTYNSSRKTKRSASTVKSLLHQFGFQRGNHQIDFNSIYSSIPPRKKTKWNHKFTALTLRDPVKQQEKFNNKVEHLMQLLQPNICKTEEDCQTKKLKIEITSKRLKAFHANHMILNRFEDESNGECKAEMYYVIDICEPSKTKTGHLLKDFKKIQGRDLSPNRCEANDVIDKNEGKHQITDNDLENDLISDCESVCVPTKGSPLESPIVVKMKPNNSSENLETIKYESPMLTPNKITKNIAKIASPDLFADSDNESEETMNYSREVSQNINPNVSHSNKSPVIESNMFEINPEITVYERFSSDEVKTFDDPQTLTTQLQKSLNCCPVIIDLTQTEDDDKTTSVEDQQLNMNLSKFPQLNEDNEMNDEMSTISGLNVNCSIENNIDKKTFIDSYPILQDSEKLALEGTQKCLDDCSYMDEFDNLCNFSDVEVNCSAVGITKSNNTSGHFEENNRYSHQIDSNETVCDKKDGEEMKELSESIISPRKRNYFGRKKTASDCSLKLDGIATDNEYLKSFELSNSYDCIVTHVTNDSSLELSDDEVNCSVRRITEANYQNGNNEEMNKLSESIISRHNENSFRKNTSWKQLDGKTSVNNLKSFELSSSYDCSSSQQNDPFLELSDDEVNYSIRQINKDKHQCGHVTNIKGNNSSYSHLLDSNKSFDDLNDAEEMKELTDSIGQSFENDNWDLKTREYEGLKTDNKFSCPKSTSFFKYNVGQENSDSIILSDDEEIQLEEHKSELIFVKGMKNNGSHGVQKKASPFKVPTEESTVATQTQLTCEASRRESKCRKTLSTSFLEVKKSSTPKSLYGKITSLIQKPDDDSISDFDEIDKLIYGSPVKHSSKIPKDLDTLLSGNLKLNLNTEIKHQTTQIKDQTPDSQEFIHNGQVYLVQTNIDSEKPDYPRMDSPTRLKELFKFGLKPLKRKQAVIMLEYIYNQTHPIIVENESSKKLQTKSNQSQDQNAIPTCSKLNKFQLSDCSGDCLIDEDKLVPESQNEMFIFQTNVSKKIHTAPLPFHVAWFNLIKSNNLLWEAVLNYDPIDLKEIYTFFKKLGMVYHPKDMKKFFDYRGIFFTYDLNEKTKARTKNVW